MDYGKSLGLSGSVGYNPDISRLTLLIIEHTSMNTMQSDQFMPLASTKQTLKNIFLKPFYPLPCSEI